MDDKRTLLYSFWDSLPPLKVTQQDKDETLNHKIRSRIIRILREGIVDPMGDYARRRALNAKEILSNIQKMKVDDKDIDKDSKNVSLQGLYFHLQKLEEAGLIQTVTILREGRHNTAYYGRTARIFNHMDFKKIEEETKNNFSAIQKFGAVQNVNFDNKTFNDLLKRYLNYQKSKDERLSKWLIQYESIIIENNINLTDFYRFMELMDTINPEYLEIFKELQKTLQLDKLP